MRIARKAKNEIKRYNLNDSQPGWHIFIRNTEDDEYMYTDTFLNGTIEEICNSINGDLVPYGLKGVKVLDQTGGNGLYFTRYESLGPR